VNTQTEGPSPRKKIMTTETNSIEGEGSSPVPCSAYRDCDGFDHDCVRCDLMADIDCDTKYPGERGTCCVCVGHDCEEARVERAKHPISEPNTSEQVGR
jgi:hypothetical protein